MGHFLHDSFLHEVDIAERAQKVDVVLGDAFANDSLNVVLALRRRLFRYAEFRPDVTGCFLQLYTYAWSCDRRMTRYANHSTHSSSILNGALVRLRSLAKPLKQSHGLAREHIAERGHVHLDGSHVRSMVLYGRSDTSRRRLLNLSLHYGALRAQFQPRGWRVILWDEIWRSQPTPDEQLAIMRNATVLITPHGAFPSVWGLLLPRGACLLEIFTKCFPYSWLPRPVLRALNVRHSSINSWTTHGSLKLIHPKSGEVLRKGMECPWNVFKPDMLDGDLLLDAQALTRHVQKTLRFSRQKPQPQLPNTVHEA